MTGWKQGSLLISLSVALSATAGGAENWTQERAGLPCGPTRFTPGGWINVIWLGGEAMAGVGTSKPELAYRPQLMRELRAAFPGAGMGDPLVSGGAGSWWGAFSAARGQAVYGQHLPGAIMFLDLAVDDEGSTEAEVGAALEGLVRSVWGSSPSTDLVFIYGLRQEHLAVYREGKVPPVIAWHERVAAHYGIPSVNVGLFAAGKIQAGELTFAEFSPDDVHPGDRGQALYAEAIKPLLLRAKAALKPGQEAPKRVLPEPLTPAPLAQAQCVPYERATLDANWRTGQLSPLAPFRHLAVSDVPGATLTLKFRGDQAGCFAAVGPDSGDLEVSVDGGEWQLRPCFDAKAPAPLRSGAQRLVAGLDPAQWHELRLRVAAKQPAGSSGRLIRLGVLLVNGDLEDPYAGMTPIQRLDALYATMDPLKYTPPAARWQLLPRTLARLNEGGTLKIVLLGDSIMNQTTHSGFDLLLQRLYPKVKIETVASVRGSTGCWWYKDENRVEEYVLKHTPDLLMIGGISQRDDVDSIRTVIQQVRAKQQPEILLITPAFGADGCTFITTWTYDIAPDASDYRAKLRQLAAGETCEFLDLTAPWWQYVKDSGKTYGWFRGDAVHANERGSQILARVLEAYFAPKR
jgi:lysophospholipase L1-like esterase